MRWCHAPLLLTGLSACIDAGDPRDLRDQDRDGWAAWQECDDLDANVHPGAEERCDGEDQDCDGEVDEDAGTGWYEDADQDGWGAGEPSQRCDPGSGSANRGEDCDDQDAGRSPDAEEVCDGVDQDCDGLIDEDAADGQAWWRDNDADGYGDAAITEIHCEAEAGWADNALDCQDQDPDAHPGGQEVCDDADEDEDCDGLIDDADPDATGQGPVYLDADGDGWGSGARALTLCDPPEGYADNAEDCDDADAGVGEPVTRWPDADGDGYGDEVRPRSACPEDSGMVDVDGDCDDADATRSPAAAEVWYDGVDQDCDDGDDFDQDGDGYASSSWGGQDCDDTSADISPSASEIWYDGVDQDCDAADDFDQDGDGQDAVALGGADCDDTNALAWEGATTRGYPGDWDCDGADDLDGATGDLSTSSARAPGYALAPAGDSDGDGLPDLLIGAPSYASTRGGAVYLRLGPASSLDAADATITTDDHYSLGLALSGGGDLDGDGYDEALLGSDSSTSSSSLRGNLWVLDGPLSGDLDLSTAGRRIVGTEEGSGFGLAMTSADLDGDGTAELVSAAPWSDEASRLGGEVYVLPADADGSLTHWVEAALSGTDEGELGSAAADAGDVDGDGLADLLLGEPDRWHLPGRAWLVYGPVSGAVDIADVGLSIEGLNNTDHAGIALAAGKDADGDGYDDLMIGAPDRGVSGMVGAGTAWFFAGPLTGDLSGSDYDARFRGDREDLHLGSALAFLDDVDGDGLADAAIGASGASVLGADAGAALIYSGPHYGSREAAQADAWIAGDPGVGLGGSLAGPGDLDGDGLSELAVGSGQLSATTELLLIRGGW